MDSEKIKQIIKSKGWTFERIGAAMGISPQAVSSIVNGNPTIDKINAIADIVGVSLDELLGTKRFKSVVFDGDNTLTASSWNELKTIVEQHQT